MTGASVALRNVALSMTLLSFLGVPGAHAQSGAPGTAQQEIGELKRTVEQLNSRIESLERQLKEQPKSSPPAPADTSRSEASRPAPATALRERWRDVARGMSVQDVEGLLGHPQRIAKIEAKTVWYYTYPDIGNGSVVFVQDNGVIDWQPPPFSVWWY